MCTGMERLKWHLTRATSTFTHAIKIGRERILYFIAIGAIKAPSL